MRAGTLPKLLLSPSVLLVLVCVYGYIMFTIYLSFTSSTLMPVYDWVGGASYQRLFGLENWDVSVRNLLVFALLYVGLAIALGLGFAILIDQQIRAEGAFRSIFLYPMALSFIVTGTAWKWLLDPAWGSSAPCATWDGRASHSAGSSRASWRSTAWCWRRCGRPPAS